MTNSIKKTTDKLSSENCIKNQLKQNYVKPALQAFGDVRDVTLGASFPGTESQTGPNPTCQIGIDPGCGTP